MAYGLKLEANPGRELYSEFNGTKYARYPISTTFVNLGDSLNDFIEKFAKPYLQQDDILCISGKVVSIANKYVVHKSEVEPTWLAKLICRFVKKWPNDIGYSNPRKMQVAINEAGYIRITLALIVGTFLKLFGVKGYFYRIAGNRINAIDGFTVGYTKNKIFEEYAFLPPKDPVKICNELSEKFNTKVAMLDGNNIENNIWGMSDNLAKEFSEKELKEILKGNPQGQEDDGNVTPMLIVRKALN